MKLRVSVLAVVLGVISAQMVGCSGSSSSNPSTAATAVDATKPSAAVGAVSTAVATAGTSMGSNGVSASSLGAEPVFHPFDISQDCSIHAQPERNGSTINSSDPDYPGKFMYCKLAYNTGDPESIQGAMSEVKSISCMLENAGVIWDGASHSYTVKSDTSCWTQAQLNNMGGGGSMTITATGSMPASFNTYYARGLTMTVPGIGTVQIGTNVTATKVEFVALEQNSANNKYDGFAGVLDFSAGEIRYELRSDRYNDTVDGSSGGFSRHQRIYAKVTTSGTTVTGLTSLSAAQAEVYNAAVQSGYGGQTITASGTLASGIKARFWATGNGSGGMAAQTSDLTHASYWTETANTRCYTSSGATGTGCTSGIAIPTTNAANSYPFALVSTTTGIYTTSPAWMTAHGAWTFTVVDPSVDVQ